MDGRGEEAGWKGGWTVKGKGMVEGRVEGMINSIWEEGG